MKILKHQSLKRASFEISVVNEPQEITKVNAFLLSKYPRLELSDIKVVDMDHNPNNPTKKLMNVEMMVEDL